VHYSVRKTLQNGRTVTVVKQLGDEERVEEITRMLAGRQITEKTRAHAQEMLQGAKEKSLRDTVQ
jgi:DNA repair protein RecN (Recombination protein N)